MNARPSGLIRPFNLAPGDYDAMYNAPLPPVLTMVLFHLLSTNEDEAWDDRISDFDQCCMNLAPPDSDDLIMPGSFLDPAQSGLAIQLAYETDLAPKRLLSKGMKEVPHAKWKTHFPAAEDGSPATEEDGDEEDGDEDDGDEDDGDEEDERRPVKDPALEHFQVAFYIPTPGGYSVPSWPLAYAMDAYDRLWMDSASLDASAHHPISVSAAKATTFDLFVGNIYRGGVGFMNRQLVEYRNKVLVGAAAAALGLDPAEEYQRFLRADGRYYTEYPGILFP